MPHSAFMGEVAALHHLPLDIVGFHYLVAALGTLHILRRQSYVEHLHPSEERLRVGEEHTELPVLQRECERGPYYVVAVVGGVVFGEQSRRHVDAHDACSRLVDVAHERGEAAAERAVESRPEESVYHHRVGSEAWRVEVAGNLVKQAVGRRRLQPFPVRSATVGEAVMDIEEKCLHTVAPLRQHPRHGEGVAAVVARPCKDYDTRTCIPLLHDGVSDGCRRTFHKVDGGYRLIVDGVSVEFVYLISC